MFPAAQVTMQTEWYRRNAQSVARTVVRPASTLYAIGSWTQRSARGSYGLPPRAPRPQVIWIVSRWMLLHGRRVSDRLPRCKRMV